MERLVGAKQLYYSETDDRPSSKMRKWEIVTSEERLEHGRGISDHLEKVCKDKNVRNLLSCFSTVLTEVDFNRKLIVSEILRAVPNLEANMVLLCNFLDHRGTKCPMPEDIDLRKCRTKFINVLVDMVLARLKNYMPNKCGTCRMWYAVPFGAIPDVICALCSRGRHDCTPVPLLYRGEGSCSWFCYDCEIMIKEEFDEGRRHGREKQKERKRPTGTTVSISSHVEVRSCTDSDTDDSDDSNSSVSSILMDPDLESISEVSLSDYDTDTYTDFQEVYEEVQQPVRNGEVKMNSTDKSTGSTAKKKHNAKNSNPQTGNRSNQINVKKLPSCPKECLVTEEEISRAIALLECDIGISCNANDASIPGICFIKGMATVKDSLATLLSQVLMGAVAPEAVKKSKVYYMVKNFRDLLN